MNIAASLGKANVCGKKSNLAASSCRPSRSSCLRYLFKFFYHEVLAREFDVVWEVVDALVVAQLELPWSVWHVFVYPPHVGVEDVPVALFRFFPSA